MKAKLNNRYYSKNRTGWPRTCPDSQFPGIFQCQDTKMFRKMLNRTIFSLTQFLCTDYRTQNETLDFEGQSRRRIEDFSQSGRKKGLEKWTWFDKTRYSPFWLLIRNIKSNSPSDLINHVKLTGSLWWFINYESTLGCSWGVDEISQYNHPIFRS